MRSVGWISIAAVAAAATASCAPAETVVPATTSTAVSTPRLADFPKISATSDWPWWRGPQGNGHADPSAKPPTAFSDAQNVVWKVPVPGRGHSSPTLVGERIFLTTADEATQVQSVVALDRAAGTQLWKVDVSQGGFPQTHNNNTHATPTVASDGERLFVTFHHHDMLQALALDFDGKTLWNVSLGEFRPQRYEYGYAPSPLPYRSTVIIAAEYDGASHITALDRATGSQVWRTARPANTTFSSPAVVSIRGRDQLVITGGDKVSSYDPATGAALWAVSGTTAATCGTVVSEGDIVFASGGYPKAQTVAVRVGAQAEVLWTNGEKCYEQSMIVVDGYLYALTDNGVLYCFQGSDGREMWRQRLRGPVSASPVYAGGHIYWANERGTMYVFKPNPTQCEMVAENQLGDESYASPAAVGERLYLRVASHAGGRQEYLYCLGK